MSRERRVNLRRVFALGAAVALGETPAGAAGIGPDDSPAYVDIHAFVSQGFILTSHNDYIDNNTTHGTAQFTEMGINVTKAFFKDRFRIGLQFFAQDLGPAGNFTVKADWFYVDYRWHDWLGLRVGRLKIPYGIYNEVNDVDSARVPILLPQSVYPLQIREFLFAQNGAELYGFLRLPEVGALDYRLFGGTIFVDPGIAVPVGSPVALQLTVPYVLGGRLFWETPLDGLRFGGTVEALHIDATAFITGTATTVLLPNDTIAWLASAEYSAHDLIFTAEYGRGHSSQGTSDAMIQPPIASTSEGGYVMATYRPCSWFQPGAYYSLSFPDVHNRDGRANRQHDLALTLRFDVTDNWLVKLEGHYMDGTAALANPLRVGPLPTAAATDWAAFFAKVTGYF
jgi:hypothetical protein